MATHQWPAAGDRSLIGKRISRLDGPEKCTGEAKYSHDMRPDGMLYAKVVGSHYPKATINGIDTSAAEALEGVEAVWVNEDIIGDEVRYGGQILAAVAATTEEIAEDALAHIKVDYEPLEAQVIDNDKKFATGRVNRREEGNVESAFAEADVVTEGDYGCPVITHCCMESHGQVAEMRGDEMYIWPSTQNASGYGEGVSESTDIPQSKIHVDVQYMGGGFGSKFGPGNWGVIGSVLAQKSGKPIHLLLDRALELMIGGNRPSSYATIKVGAKKDGSITAVQADIWGTSGAGGYRNPPVPYVFSTIPNVLVTGQGIRTNRGSQQAWRAPGHPQGCFLTMSALEDAAAALNMDALEFFRKNLHLTEKAKVYEEELLIAAELIGYKDKAHLRGQGDSGPVKRGIGMSIHRWGGMGHDSECDINVNSDGTVEVRMGTQDLGQGSRTVLAIVAGETFGLPVEAIQVYIGKSAYPPSGASGGSTTVGGTSAAVRLGATEAVNKLLAAAATRMDTSADALEAKDGQIREIANPSNSMSWKDACGLLGPSGIRTRGICVPGEAEQMGLMTEGAGGAQMADVSVDTETGVVTINEVVAAQDCGLIIDMKTTESQVYGALIMGVTYALYEEVAYDPTTGRMLNADMEFYRLAGIKDVGKLTVHMMTGPGYDERGVIGIGEPPVISPGAAISNAVANAIGVRVPELPLTPDRVLRALEQGGSA